MRESMGKKCLMKLLCISLIVVGIICKNIPNKYFDQRDLSDSISKIDSRSCSSEEFTKLTGKYGYPTESHFVTTKDGYILQMFRIQKKHTPIKRGLKPVILQHGLIDSSDNWVLNDEDKSLAFLLANLGYDVWIPNSRGNQYSISHKDIKTTSAKFWDFSFSEMGRYDVPAIIAYVLEVSGFNKLIYVGHSQGTTAFFSALTDPVSSRYVNSRIEKFIALGPVVYLANMQNTFFDIFVRHSEPVAALIRLVGVHELFPGSCSTSTASSFLMKELCTLAKGLCNFGMTVAEFNPVYENQDRWPEFADHHPCGTSDKTLFHFQQLSQCPKNDPCFRMYDYGKKGNLEHYGQATPPDYDFSRIQVPISFFMGKEDNLGNVVDNTMFQNKLRALGKQFNSYTYDNWGHMTFMWGKNPYRVFDDIVREISGNKDL